MDPVTSIASICSTTHLSSVDKWPHSSGGQGAPVQYVVPVPLNYVLNQMELFE